MPAQKTLPAVAGHGSARLPAVNVEDYNVELQDDEGFIGDKASKGAFRQIIDNWREAEEIEPIPSGTKRVPISRRAA